MVPRFLERPQCVEASTLDLVGGEWHQRLQGPDQDRGRGRRRSRTESQGKTGSTEGRGRTDTGGAPQGREPPRPPPDGRREPNDPRGRRRALRLGPGRGSRCRAARDATAGERVAGARRDPPTPQACVAVPWKGSGGAYWPAREPSGIKPSETRGSWVRGRRVSGVRHRPPAGGEASGRPPPLSPRGPGPPPREPGRSRVAAPRRGLESASGSPRAKGRPVSPSRRPSSTATGVGRAEWTREEWTREEWTPRYAREWSSAGGAPLLGVGGCSGGEVGAARIGRRDPHRALRVQVRPRPGPKD